MTAAPALVAASNTVTDAGHADRALLAAMRVAVGGMSAEVCRHVVGDVLLRHHQVFGALLRAVAIRGLDDATAAHVGAQIDAAIAGTGPKATFRPPEIRMARNEEGGVEFRCQLDLAAMTVSVAGPGYSASMPEGEEPKLRAFTATVAGVPSSNPTYIVPAAPHVVNVNPPPPTRQVISRDEQGEIVAIDTVPQ